MEKKKMSEEYTCADEVWFRIVQIVQEALLTGTDCADLLRQIRLSKGDNDQMILSATYKEQVKRMHEKLLENAEAIKNGNQQ